MHHLPHNLERAVSFVKLAAAFWLTVCQSSICLDLVRFPALSQIKPHAPRACGAFPSIPLSFTCESILPLEGNDLSISTGGARLTRALHGVQHVLERRTAGPVDPTLALLSYNCTYILPRWNLEHGAPIISDVSVLCQYVTWVAVTAHVSVIVLSFVDVGPSIEFTIVKMLRQNPRGVYALQGAIKLNSRLQAGASE